MPSQTLIAGSYPRCRVGPAWPEQIVVAEPDPHCRARPSLPGQILIAGSDRQSTRKARCSKQRAFFAFFLLARLARLARFGRDSEASDIAKGGLSSACEVQSVVKGTLALSGVAPAFLRRRTGHGKCLPGRARAKTAMKSA